MQGASVPPVVAIWGWEKTPALFGNDLERLGFEEAILNPVPNKRDGLTRLRHIHSVRTLGAALRRAGGCRNLRSVRDSRNRKAIAHILNIVTLLSAPSNSPEIEDALARCLSCSLNFTIRIDSWSTGVMYGIASRCQAEFADFMTPLGIYQIRHKLI
jgi:hypothetical protein